MFGGLCRPRSPDAAAAGALSAEPRAEVPMAVPAARSWRRFRERADSKEPGPPPLAATPAHDSA
jgi:hypothetical protein